MKNTKLIVTQAEKGVLVEYFKDDVKQFLLLKQGVERVRRMDMQTILRIYLEKGMINLDEIDKSSLTEDLNNQLVLIDPYGLPIFSFTKNEIITEMIKNLKVITWEDVLEVRENIYEPKSDNLIFSEEDLDDCLSLEENNSYDIDEPLYIETTIENIHMNNIIKITDIEEAGIIRKIETDEIKPFIFIHNETTSPCILETKEMIIIIGKNLKTLFLNSLPYRAELTSYNKVEQIDNVIIYQYENMDYFAIRRFKNFKFIFCKSINEEAIKCFFEK